LLVAEVALACTLLVGATLLVRSFINLAHAERGLDVDGVLVTSLSLGPPAFPDRAARQTAARLIEERVRRLPGVQHVAWSYGLPPDGGAISFGKWQSDAPGNPVVDMNVDRYRVGPEFFELYNIPLLRGRTFEPSDGQGSVVIGERLARTLWPGQEPIGRIFRFQEERFEVVGLVREIHHPSLDATIDRPEFYEPFAGVGSYAMMSIRCGATCPNTAFIRQQVLATHSAVRVVTAQALEDVYIEQLARPRAAAAWALRSRELPFWLPQVVCSVSSAMQLDAGGANSAFERLSERHPTRFGAWFFGTALSLPGGAWRLGVSRHGRSAAHSCRCSMASRPPIHSRGPSFLACSALRRWPRRGDRRDRRCV